MVEQRLPLPATKGIKSATTDRRYWLPVPLLLQDRNRSEGAPTPDAKEHFAGGLPNPKFIPVEAIADAIREMLAEQGAAALQYYSSEGHLPLRQWIADQYAADGLAVTPEQILITTGSQQGLDLLGKVLIDPGDKVIVEDPSPALCGQEEGRGECSSD